MGIEKDFIHELHHACKSRLLFSNKHMEGNLWYKKMITLANYGWRICISCWETYWLTKVQSINLQLSKLNKFQESPGSAWHNVCLLAYFDKCCLTLITCANILLGSVLQALLGSHEPMNWTGLPFFLCCGVVLVRTRLDVTYWGLPPPPLTFFKEPFLVLEKYIGRKVHAAAHHI